MKKNVLQISLLSLSALAVIIISTSCGRSSDDHSETATVTSLTDQHDDHDHSGMIKLSSHEAHELGVQSEKISEGDFSEVILVSGSIESIASDESVASATRSGILTISPNINTGVRVAAGSSIGSIRSSSVQGGDPTVQAKATRDAAKRELDRLAPLHKDGIVSTQVYNDALSAFEQAEAALKSSRQGSSAISSPKSGVITQLLAKSGEYVETGQRIAVISGNTNLTLRADVPEKYVMRLAGIETANFRTASSSETISLDDLDGRIISNASTSVAENGYIPIYFSFNNNGAVAPGAFAEVYLKSGVRHGVLSVPKEAIVEINGNKCVYSRHGDELYEKHVVTLGASDGQRVEILSGLAPDEEVVVKGATIVRMAETSATAVPGHTHNH